MKRTLKLIALCILAGRMAFAGGIVTNTNQSVKWLRMMSRDASTDIDAIYFNPAGVTALQDGFHFSLSNQNVFQDYTITSTFPTLNESEYSADVKAPLFPNIYASYKKEKWAVSFMFGPIGGGGKGEYSKGLPDFETAISTLPNTLVNKGIPTTAYSVDQYFKGSSMSLGFQASFAYEINDYISASVGGRFVYSKNEYTGHLKDVMINPTYPVIGYTGDMVSANDFLTTIGQTTYAALVADKEVDVTQKGIGFCPIIGVNITPFEKLNIGLRWEGNTSIDLENDTKSDIVNDISTGETMFPDGEKFGKDIPMFISAGAQYQITDDFRGQVSYHMYFDKNADWDGNEDKVDDNMYEILLGLEYDISEMFTVSAGWQRCKTGVSGEYQSDLSFSLSSNTIGIGGMININDNLSVDVGFARILYEDMDVANTFGSVSYTTTYDKDGYMFGIGLNYSLF